MAIWITSDWHFNHNKPFIYEARGFISVEEMNKNLIINHNALVDKDDDVFVLGDLMLGGADRLEEGVELIQQMNGKLHIIRGNHDSDKRCIAYAQMWPKVVEIKNADYLNYSSYHFYLSHYPSMTSNYDDDKPLKQRLINLCGHTHTTNMWQDVQVGAIHCEVDAHWNFPVLLDDLIEDLKLYY